MPVPGGGAAEPEETTNPVPGVTTTGPVVDGVPLPPGPGLGRRARRRRSARVCSRETSPFFASFLSPWPESGAPAFAGEPAPPGLPGGVACAPFGGPPAGLDPDGKSVPPARYPPGGVAGDPAGGSPPNPGGGAAPGASPVTTTVPFEGICTGITVGSFSFGLSLGLAGDRKLALGSLNLARSSAEIVEGLCVASSGFLAAGLAFFLDFGASEGDKACIWRRSVSRMAWFSSIRSR